MIKPNAFLIAAAFFAFHTPAYAVDNNYDMSVFLNQQHPFLVQSQRSPTPAIPAARTVQSSHTPKSHAKTDVAPQMAETTGPKAGKPWGGISEVRVGTLAHDVGPFSAKKEGGVDTNLEVLFASPDFLDLVW